MPIPDIGKIAESEQYNSMIKFDADVIHKITAPNAKLFLPETIIQQYVGNKKYEKSELDKEIDGLMFWHSNRGIITRMILIPESTHKLLLDMGDCAEEFLDYFEDKDPIHLQKHKTTYAINGISSNYRHPDTAMYYYANNGIYIRMEKKIVLK